MIRLGLVLAGLLALALIVAFFADEPGQVRIDWLGYAIQTSVAALMAGLVVLLLLVTGATRGLIWLLKEAPFSKPQRRDRQTKRGYATLNKAMVALASGDEKEARRLSRNAGKLLPPQPLTHIIGAETARLTDDNQARRQHFEALTQDSEAAFLGIRGLINVARDEGREADALDLAVKAVAMRPQSRWALKTRFDLEVKAAKWDEAADSLTALRSAKALDEKTAKRHGAVLDYCRAVEAELQGHDGQALELTLSAHKVQPAFAPASILAAKLLHKEGQDKRAHRVLKSSFDQQPHPALVEADLKLMDTATAHERLSRAKKLADKRPNETESRLAIARYALAADHVDEARTQLAPLVEQIASRRAYEMMADIAARTHGTDDPQVDHWKDLARQADSLPGRWSCSVCQSVRENWTPVCPTCRSFDSYSWATSKTPAIAHQLPKPNPAPTDLTRDIDSSLEKSA